MQFHELMAILQAAIGPVILISGAGLLMLSMTNRFGRLLDRSRELGADLRRAPRQGRDRLESQLQILLQRAGLLRWTISFATLSVLLAAILVIALFLSAFLQVDGVLLGVVLFISCLVSLIVSLLGFLQDINLSLLALKLELERNVARRPTTQSWNPGKGDAVSA
jgi:hypothetical protein